ncbi:hypothetical protein PV682_32065 [Streptomyces niveiscabiei]|uniref:hypothetical protein n=1 Tax=Streptomyces niveiscabiei TaxID=164115 RepID=UPI0029A17775|nr:hypothetical protein [Streptomyces niveiscabiei]MDX3386060.1 hypothetical protein [Streptomyces niveiscabiei]
MPPRTSRAAAVPVALSCGLLGLTTPTAHSLAAPPPPGVVHHQFPSAASAAAADIAEDGSTVVAVNTDNGITLVRFTPAGRFDTDFGENGYARLAETPASAAAVALSEDGTVTVTGTGGKGILLARYDRDGVPDDRFGLAGIAHGTGLLAGAGAEAAALAVQEDGQPVIAATAPVPGASGTGTEDKRRLVVARYGLDGTPDAGFGTAGLHVSPAAVPESAAAIALQANENVVVAGQSTLPEGDRPTLWSLTPDGEPAPGFGSRGKVLTSQDLARGVSRNMVVGSSDEIVLVGSLRNSFAAARHLPDGSPDPAFGTTGVTGLPTQDPADANVVDVAEDGRVLAAGTLGSRLGVAAFTPSGTPDRHFGTHQDGVARLTFDAGNPPQNLAAILLSGADDITLVGSSANRIALARLTGRGTPEESFGAGAQ